MTRNEISKEIMKKTVADGRKAAKFENVIVRNVHVTDKREEGVGNVMLSFTTNKNDFDTYRLNEATGAYEDAKTAIIFPSYFGVAAVLREDPIISPLVDTLLENDAALKILLNNAKITVIQEPVAEGEVYQNPYSTKVNPDAEASDHKWYAYHVDSIELNEQAKTYVNRMIDKILGI